MSHVVADPPRTRGHDLFGLAGFAVAVALAAATGAAAAASARETYAALDLPPFAPPAAVFGPVWTVLYVVIAVAAWLTWRRVGWDTALTFWLIQVVLLAIWTPLFFGGDLYSVALAEIILLCVVAATTAWMFWQRHRIAGLLMVPFVAWVLFATLLNLEVTLRN